MKIVKVLLGLFLSFVGLLVIGTVYNATHKAENAARNTEFAEPAKSAVVAPVQPAPAVPMYTLAGCPDTPQSAWEACKRERMQKVGVSQADFDQRDAEQAAQREANAPEVEKAYNFAAQELVRSIGTNDMGAFLAQKNLSPQYLDYCQAWRVVVEAYREARDSENYRKWVAMTTPAIVGHTGSYGTAQYYCK